MNKKHHISKSKTIKAVNKIATWQIKMTAMKLSTATNQLTNISSNIISKNSILNCSNTLHC